MNLNKYLKNLTGNVMAIGLEEKYIKILQNNDKITSIALLNPASGKTKKRKKVKINKINKKIKKKSIDYIVVNYAVVKDYLNIFVKNSVYINKNKLLFYNVSNNELILKKYKRYNTIINTSKDTIEIDNSASCNNFIKDWFYIIIDFLTNLIELLADYMMG